MKIKLIYFCSVFLDDSISYLSMVPMCWRRDWNDRAGLSVNETTTVRSLGSTSTANSKIIIDSPDDIMPIQSDTDSVRSSVIFFSASLSMFAAIGIIIFFRKCVTCPTRRHGRRRHYYPTLAGRGQPNADETEVFSRAVVGSSVPTVVVETDALDETEELDAITFPLTPTMANNGDQEEEINFPSCCSPRRLSRGLADSTSGFRFYDDDGNIDDDDDDQQEWSNTPPIGASELSSSNQLFSVHWTANDDCVAVKSHERPSVMFHRRIVIVDVAVVDART